LVADQELGEEVEEGEERGRRGRGVKKGSEEEAKRRRASLRGIWARRGRGRRGDRDEKRSDRRKALTACYMHGCFAQ
jgi:hypothetical protein